MGVWRVPADEIANRLVAITSAGTRHTPMSRVLSDRSVVEV